MRIPPVRIRSCFLFSQENASEQTGFVSVYIIDINMSVWLILTCAGLQQITARSAATDISLRWLSFIAGCCHITCKPACRRMDGCGLLGDIIFDLKQNQSANIYYDINIYSVWAALQYLRLPYICERLNSLLKEPCVSDGIKATFVSVFKVQGSTTCLIVRL